MESVSGTTGLTSSSSVTTQNQVTQSAQTAATESASVSDFEKYLRANLTSGGSGKVSEEELFASVMGERLNGLKGEEVAKAYREELEKNKSALKSGDGYIPFEDAAKKTLQALVEKGSITKDEGNKIYSESFQAAQLDSNLNALYDDRGGPGDSTIAVETLEAALLSARVKIESLSGGSDKLTARELSEPTLSKSQLMGSSAAGSASSLLDSASTALAGGGFLFKPVAGDGRLAVLSPNKVGPNVESITLKDASGNVIEKGHFTSYGDDGRMRAKFSFSKPGGSYPKNLMVEILYKDGQTQQYQIDDPSKRHE